MKRVKCIIAHETNGLTLFKDYTVIKEYTAFYELLNDDNEIQHYCKDRFIKTNPLEKGLTLNKEEIEIILMWQQLAEDHAEEYGFEEPSQKERELHDKLRSNQQ